MMPGGHNFRRSDKMVLGGVPGCESRVKKLVIFFLKELFDLKGISLCSTVYGAYLARKTAAAILQTLRPFFILCFFSSCRVPATQMMVVSGIFKKH